MYAILRAFRQLLDMLWSALQPVFRFLAWLLFLLATIAFMIDLTRWQLQLPGEATTPLAKYLSDWAPGSIVATQRFIETNVSPILWDPVITGFLDVTPWISFTLLGMLMMWAGYRRERISVFAN